ncbi:hypothetical protein ATETN484_0012009600 [Aspergillus terreus]|nr:hypothetical protein ATETN484_0012009600 [Aspergillus terreus]
MSSNNTRPCDFPDGNLAKNNVPCTAAPHTACCSASDICLSNGFCMNINHQSWTMPRGACTNQAWDGGCPDRCISGNDYPHGSYSIINLSYEAGRTCASNGPEISRPGGIRVAASGRGADGEGADMNLL